MGGGQAPSTPSDGPVRRSEALGAPPTQERQGSGDQGRRPAAAAGAGAGRAFEVADQVNGVNAAVGARCLGMGAW